MRNFRRHRLQISKTSFGVGYVQAFCFSDRRFAKSVLLYSFVHTSMTINQNHLLDVVMARVMQHWLQANCPGIIEKNHRTQYSTGLNPMDCHVWGAMLEKYLKLLKPKMMDELKEHLERAATRTHQQSDDKHQQALDCLHGCQWWSLRASTVRVHFQVCILISAPKNWLFSEPPTYSQRKCPKCS